jgi:uncharacterized protein (TIGR02391 family)
MKPNWENRLLDILPKLQKIFVGVGAIFFLGLGIYKGITTEYGFLVGLFVGIIGAVLILGSYVVIGIWSITTDSLSDFIGKYPKIRRSFIIVFSISVFIATLIFVTYWELDLSFKVVLVIIFLVLLPSAILSIIQEDRRRESFKLLGNQITPELIAQSPQAAIEHAFTIFEDHLRSRLGVSSATYGEGLINEAFKQNGKLLYSEVESENNGVRNLMAGAYATYRNPRKHRLVQDDKESAIAIIALVELLIHIVDESFERSGQ